MKRFKVLSLLLFLLNITLLPVLSASAHAGIAIGNGGDYVRATFIKVGQAVVSYLKETDAGQDLVKQNNLDLNALRSTLTIKVISVDQGAVLIDNGGSGVDATGEPGKIALSKNAWIEHFEKNRDVYYLVFHEMLRALAVNDDNYVVSGALNPFPQNRRVVTRIATTFPLIGDEQLVSQMIGSQNIAVAGTGCPSTTGGTLVDFDLERNTMDLAFQNYVLSAGSVSGRRLDRKSCQLAIPVKIPAGKKLIVSQLDMYAKVDFPNDTTGQIGLEAFLAGSQGPLIKKDAQNTSSMLRGRLLLRRNDVLASNCGGSDTLRLNTNALVNHDGDTSSQLEVDRITLSFKVESCSNTPTTTAKVPAKQPQ